MAHQTDAELLLELGTDGLAWANKFTSVLAKNSSITTSQLNEISEIALGYFANAIENAKSVGRSQREVPGELLQVEQLNASIEELKQEFRSMTEDRDNWQKTSYQLREANESLKRELSDVRQCASTLGRIMEKLGPLSNNQAGTVINIHGPCTITATS